jgi:hypothetical protein
MNLLSATGRVFLFFRSQKLTVDPPIPSFRRWTHRQRLKLKGTVSRDLRTLFFHQTSAPRSLIHILNIFENCGEFAKILEFQITDDTTEPWLSGVIDNAKTKLSVVIGASESVKMKFVHDLAPWLSGVNDITESKLSGIIDITESGIASFKASHFI